MTPRKYRVIITTIRGRYLAASSDSVNGMADTVYYYLVNTPAGQAIYDDQVRSVGLYEFDTATGQYIPLQQSPATSRKDVLSKLRLMGAR